MNDRTTYEAARTFIDSILGKEQIQSANKGRKDAWTKLRQMSLKLLGKLQ